MNILVNINKTECICFRCEIVFYLRPCDIKAGRGKFCSQDCYKKHRLETKKKDVHCKCKNCDIDFFIKPHLIKFGYGKYCSQKCQWEGMKRREYAICKSCNKEFEVTLSLKENGRGIYCSTNCKHMSLKKVIKVNCCNCGSVFSRRPFEHKKKFCSIKCLGEGRRTRVTLSCKNCGNFFTAEPNRIAVGKGLFCSLNCYRETFPGKVTRECKWCKSEFEVFPSLLKQVGGGSFCGRQCSGSYKTSLQGGRRSSIEIMVESELKKLDFVFYSQYRIFKYLCDFYVPHLNLVIECDGDYWHSRPEVIKRDRIKDEWMKNNDYNIVRLKETDIRADANRALLNKIEFYI